MGDGKRGTQGCIGCLISLACAVLTFVGLFWAVSYLVRK